MTNNKTHEDLKKEMQKAWEEYIIEDVDDIEIPKPDLSFLEKSFSRNSEKEELNLTFLSMKKRSSPFKRITKVAAVVLAIFITSSVIGIYLSSESSYSVRTMFLNIKHYFSASQPALDDNNVKTLTVSDWQKIEEGREIVGVLYVPKYIPAKYKFDKVSFNNSESFIITNYKYVNGDHTLSVIVQVIIDDTEAYIEGDLCKSPISGRDMYLEEDKEGGERILTYPNPDKTFSVVSEINDISQKEAFKIVESITKKQD